MSGSVNKVIEMYVSELRSIPQIATELGMPRSRVRTLLVNSGTELRSRADGVRLRRDILGKHAVGVRRAFTAEWKENIARARRDWGEKNAKGVRVTPSGYIEFTRGPHKGRSQHVLMMEERLGRRLRPDECVHHIDGNPANNHPDNLALVTRRGHSLLHVRERRIAKENRT